MVVRVLAIDDVFRNEDTTVNVGDTVQFTNGVGLVRYQTATLELTETDPPMPVPSPPPPSR